MIYRDVLLLFLIYLRTVVQIHAPDYLSRSVNNYYSVTFTALLTLASQRAEYVVIELFGPAWMQEILLDWKRRERGSFPGLVESALIIYVISKCGHRFP